MSSATSPVLIKVENVYKRFPLPEGKGEFTVLSQIDLEVRAGEVLALLGRSGSGKSTLLRIMAGLIPLAKGRCGAMADPCAAPTPTWPWCFKALPFCRG